MRIFESRLGFRGRASRRTFWLYLAIALPSLIALGAGFYVYAMSVPGAYENGGPAPWPSNPLGMIAAVTWIAAIAILLIGLLAVSVRRLHDRDKAWWWVLIFIVAPNLLSSARQIVLDGGNERLDDVAFAAGFAALALFLWGLVELGFLRGTQGGNRYGPDPLNASLTV